MSTRLLKESLDLLSNPTSKTNSNSNNTRKRKLPETKQGLKRIKHEIRYGHSQKGTSGKTNNVKAAKGKETLTAVEKYRLEEEKKKGNYLDQNLGFLLRSKNDSERELKKKVCMRRFLLTSTFNRILIDVIRFLR